MCELEVRRKRAEKKHVFGVYFALLKSAILGHFKKKYDHAQKKKNKIEPSKKTTHMTFFFLPRKSCIFKTFSTFLTLCTKIVSWRSGRIWQISPRRLPIFWRGGGAQYNEFYYGTFMDCEGEKEGEGNLREFLRLLMWATAN